MPLRKGEAGNRGGGVRTDAGQGSKVSHGGGHLARMLFGDNPGSGMQPERPPRVAKAAPLPHGLARCAPSQ